MVEGGLTNAHYLAGLRSKLQATILRLALRGLIAYRLEAKGPLIVRKAERGLGWDPAALRALAAYLEGER